MVEFKLPVAVHLLLLSGALLLGACGTDVPPEEENNTIVIMTSCGGPSDCDIGKTCKEGKCISADAQCVADADCGPDRRCDNGVCFNKEREVRPVPDGGIPDPVDPVDAGDGDMGPEPCNGCEDPDTGECLAGNAVEACGGGGSVCMACEPGDSCDEGTCVSPPSCDPTACDGCCDGDECVTGDSDEACGLDGACQQCASPTVCEAGECVTPCNEDTCDGCCNGDGECVEGAVTSACGTGGIECMTCGSDQNCSAGECVDRECSDTCIGCCDGDQCLSGDLDGACGWFGVACVGCGTGMTCSIGQCVVDPDSKWNVEVISATVPDRNASGGTWDSFGGLPDPYVRLKTEDDPVTFEESTTVISDTTSPFWFETILVGVPARALKDRLTVWVRDSDTFGDTTMGSCYSEFVQSDFSGSAFDINCPAHDDQVAVTVRLRVTPN